jgi:hypothetical protein
MAVAGAVGVLTSGVAVAASCRVVIVQNDPPVGLALSPKDTDVDYGGCVQFSDNAVGPPVTVTVQGGYTVTLDYGESTGSRNSYQATASGAHSVTADNGAGSAHGSITVGASPSPSASPTSTSSSPAPRPRPSVSSSSSGPQVAPTPSSTTPPTFRTPSAAPVPSAGRTVPHPGMTPTVMAAPTATPTSSPSPVAVAAGPIQPPTGRDLGLPAAIAALALVGVATALLRVLLAHAPAVDGRRTVGESA